MRRPYAALVDLPFTASFVVLCVAQGLAVAPSGEVSPLRRLGAHPLLGLIPLAGIGGGVLLLGNVAGAPQRAADLATFATPLLALAGLRALAGAWRLAALLAPALYVVAWQAPGTRWADVASLILIVAACGTLAVLTGLVAPRWALALGIVVAAVVDVVQILNQDVQPVAQALSLATPPSGLPRLQEARYAGATMGWGDVYLAALLGVVIGTARRRRVAGVLLVTLAATAWGFLFLVLDTIPATVPVAVALLVLVAGDRVLARELVPRRRGRARAVLRGSGTLPPHAEE